MGVSDYDLLFPPHLRAQTQHHLSNLLHTNVQPRFQDFCFLGSTLVAKCSCGGERAAKQSTRRPRMLPPSLAALAATQPLVVLVFTVLGGAAADTGVGAAAGARTPWAEVRMTTLEELEVLASVKLRVASVMAQPTLIANAVRKEDSRHTDGDPFDMSDRAHVLFALTTTLDFDPAGPHAMTRRHVPEWFTHPAGAVRWFAHAPGTRQPGVGEAAAAMSDPDPPCGSRVSELKRWARENGLVTFKSDPGDMVVFPPGWAHAGCFEKSAHGRLVRGMLHDPDAVGSFPWLRKHLSWLVTNWYAYR